MKYITALLVFLPLFASTQDIGVYIDSLGRVSIGKDTVWEPFQVFAETGPQLQLDQQSAEMGNTAGLLIAPDVENGQSFTCGLTGQLASVSLRLGTVPDAGNTMLELNIRESSAPTGPILATSSFAISDDEMQWYDIAVTPVIDVMPGDEFFIEVVHTGGDQAEWDWVEGTNPYSGGTSWQHQTSWFEITSSDFVFRTFVIADEKTDVLSVTSSGKVKVNDYLLPQFDGMNNQVMVTNGTGVLSWQDMTAGGGALIQDADGDTKVQVEESVDEDIIRFDMGGTEYFRMDAGRLKILNTGNSVIIGDEAGIFEDLGGNDNVFIGTSAGWANNGISNTVIGNGALSSNWTGGSNTAIGRSALGFGNTGSGNTAVGWQALVSNAGTHNTGIGAASLQLNSSGNYNTVVGHSALVSNLSGHWNTAIGWAAGNNNSSGSANVFLGYLAGANETGSNKLYIANSGAGPTGALIYGDFLDQLLRINGTLNINNAYSFPTTDGSLGQVLQTDGSGLLSWQTVSGGGGGSSIEDTDGDTKIQTEEIANEDKIRFDLGGTEHFVMDGPRLEVKNSGRSVFLGQGAGANDDLTNRNNTFIGYQSGLSSVGGENNSAIGAYAFESSVNGSYNTVHGVQAMRNSSGGESNSAFGYNALNSNTSSSNVAMGASALSSNLDGHANVGVGSSSLSNNTTGDHNTAIGTQALFSNTAGSRGTAIGYHAMLYGNNSTSSSFENHNVAIGYEALRGSGVASANTGNANTAIGYQAMVNNSSGFQNTATGSYALTSNTWGTDNTASGSYALWANTTGTYNTASGYRALYLNIDGTHNTASGVESLQGNTTGDYNAAYGTSSLYSNISGNNNTALGVLALASNKAGSAGTAIGYGAMHYSNNTTTPFVNTNVAVGFEALRGSATPGSNTGLYNTAVGYRALMPNTSGSQNTAFGYSTLTSNTTGDYNLAMGVDALGSNISGNENTAAGNFALRRNTGGHWNTGLGFSALEENTTGTYNTALGHEALNANVGGTRATAIGTHAMRYANNTLSEFNNGNIAVGFEALRGSAIPANNTGNWNTVIGYESMRLNTIGEGNTATGYTAMRSNVTGVYNTAIGFEALRNNTHHRNTAVGTIALKANTSGENNTAVGTFALENNSTGGNNTALGFSANSLVGNFTNSMGLGYEADPTATNRVHIGNNSVSWIGGQVAWATYSDGRFKSDITEEVVGLDFINELRPVTYNIDLDEIQDWKALHYNEKDSSNYAEKYEIETYRFSGFIAQEVESASRNAGYEFSGVCPPKHDKDFYSLRYAEFVVPLVKAVQELSEENEKLKTTNDTLMDLLADLQQRVESLELSASQSSGH